MPGSFDTVTSLHNGFRSERAAAGLGPSGLTNRVETHHGDPIIYMVDCDVEAVGPQEKHLPVTNGKQEGHRYDGHQGKQLGIQQLTAGVGHLSNDKLTLQQTKADTSNPSPNPPCKLLTHSLPCFPHYPTTIMLLIDLSTNTRNHTSAI